MALMTTGELATALRVSRGAILKWHRAGQIKPEFVTPGGHPRWDVDRVREQLDEWAKREEERRRQAERDEQQRRKRDEQEPDE